ncbi:DUF1444 family protein [Brevibacillus ruminantium]|uniref:DUF1444 family protein n=1 Tax=Brevibacillus ruminantium TaxID=2950604 RepID=A0ABY4WLW2_9BACL|nr:DUF1444 family protein [Brevibacillus ruminantium]USG68077.1 DUF1444 family protein [Brevibacillus ruminantium]
METSRQSLMNKVVESVKKQLPSGLSCVGEGERILIGRTDAGERKDRALLEIPLAPLFSRAEKSPQDAALFTTAFVERVLVIVRGQLREHRLEGAEEQIYPVLRHLSFIKRAPERWAYQPHTAETAILYAIDDREGYQLIEKNMLEETGWTIEKLHQQALDNLQRLPVPKKKQQVGPHLITFIAPTDGYAASRVLHPTLLQEMEQNRTGDALGVAIPHPDVLIIGDLHGKTGADLLTRLAYDFSSKSSLPISPLPFFWEKGELIPFLAVSHEKKHMEAEDG